jgi:hypothetical protein
MNPPWLDIIIGNAIAENYRVAPVMSIHPVLLPLYEAHGTAFPGSCGGKSDVCGQRPGDLLFIFERSIP